MIDDFYQLDPYELNKEDKNRLLMSELIELIKSIAVSIQAF